MGNSVIYRPAYDAEIEYLESDSNSFVDTGLKASSELGILAHIRVSSTKRWLFGGANGLADREFGFLIDSTTLTSYRYGTHTVNLGGLSLNTTYEFDNIQNHNVMKVGSLTFTATASTFTSDYNLYLFTENRNGSPSGTSSGIRIYDFKIYQNSTLVRDFIPVRIGQIGYMYDKVTKQLFANKGTGQFTLGNDVSNAVIPQQRCVILFPMYDSQVEYLESTGTQWIDTEFIPDASTTSFELDISFEGQFVYSGTRKGIITTSVNESDTQKFTINFGDRSIDGNRIYWWFGRAYDGHTVPNSLNEVALTRGIFSYSQGIGSYNGKSVNLNNSEYPPVAGRREGTMLILKDFECYTARLYSAKIWDNNVLIRDFIPVRIGNVGYMYDKISKQLFANKGTGSFTLGSDTNDAVASQRSVVFERIYEEYEWLVGHLNDGVSPSGQSNGANFRLDRSIDLTNKVMKMEFDAPYRDFAIVGGVAADGHQYVLRTFIMENGTQVLRETIGSTIINSNSQSTKNDEVIFDFVNNVASAGSISIPIQGTGYSYSNAYGVYNSATKTMGNITIDNELNLVPCKLLQSIPATLDGNGIARQAGECGMWDKVNDKFYGNVASGGSFTVSND